MVTPELAVQTEKLTLDIYMQLYESEGPFEILDGERRSLMPFVSGHGAISKKLVVALLVLEAQGEGEVYYETPFVLVDTPDWVKASQVPDVMFYNKARISDYKTQNPDWKKKPFILVPDLVIEIVSENDHYSELAHKVKLYLQDGVKLVWVIDPKHRSVAVYQPAQAVLFLEASDRLRGGEVLPGFEMEIAHLFE